MPRRFLKEEEGPEPESEEIEYVSRAGGMSSPISSQEALKEVQRQAPPEMHKHATITINKYGKMGLQQAVEEETKEE